MIAALLFALPGSALDLPHSDATDAYLPQAEREQIFGSGDEEAWNPIADNTYNRSRPGGNWVGTKFYLVGGELSSTEWGISRADKVEIFDGATRTWSVSAASMPLPVSNIMSSTAVVNGMIYVVGGYTAAGTPIDAIQIYDTATDTWSVAPHTYPIGPIMGCLAVALDDGRIFACGGKSQITVPTTLIYDPETGEFTPLTPMPWGRYYTSGAREGNTVYVVGGHLTGKVFHSYDLEANTWTVLANLPEDRAGCGVYADNGYVVMSMGDWGGYRRDSVVWSARTQQFYRGLLPDAARGRRAFAYDLLTYGDTYYLGAFNGWAGEFIFDNEVMDY